MGISKAIYLLIPTVLTTSSIICIIAVCLAGISNKDAQLLEVTTADFSASPDTLQNLAHEILPRDLPVPRITELLPSLTDQDKNTDVGQRFPSAGAQISHLKAKIDAISQDGNITAKTLGLADKYEVALWNYCRVTATGLDCTKPTFNWATRSLNASEIEEIASEAAGKKVSLPGEIKAGMTFFAKISKWTQLVYLFATFNGISSIFLGLIAVFSHGGSFLTFFISCVATISILTGSILATAQAIIASSVLNGVSKAYHVSSQANASFLTTTWFAVVFSLGATIFWAISNCCCCSTGRSEPLKSSYMEKQSYERMNEP